MTATMSLKLPDYVRESLKCIKCSNYLSVSPIVCNEGGLLCGRCAPEDNLPLQRATQYEALAQLFRFPCKNQEYGCKDEFDWNSMKNHESNCQFHQLRCPALLADACPWSGGKNLLIDHFSIHHKDLTINPSSYFYLPYKQDTAWNKLLVHKNTVLLLQLSNDVEQGKCWIGLSSIENTGANIAYTIEFKAAENSATMVLQRNVEFDKTASWKIDRTKMLPVDIGTIKAFLQSNNIMCKLEIVNKENKKEKEGKENLKNSNTSIQNFDERLLKELECFVCFEYMVPPIFICVGGHSICGSCKQTKGIITCPLCKLNVTNTRNFHLENITTAAKYPCKNNTMGCSFTGNSKTIRIHEKHCNLLFVDCPFNCSWKGNVVNTIEHAKAVHNINTTWSLSDTLFRNLRSSIIVDYYLVKYEKKVFKVGFKHVSITGPVHWVVQEVGRHCTDKPKYRYTLKFVDQTYMGREFMINNLCYGIGDAPEFANCTMIPYELLKPYINSEDQLIFKLNICKI